MRKAHKNHLASSRIENLLNTFAIENGYDFLNASPLSVRNNKNEHGETYLVSLGTSYVETTNNGLDIGTLDQNIENVVKAAFIAGTFVEALRLENASFEYIRRYAGDEENRIKLLYRYDGLEFYFQINVMGIVVTTEAESKGDKDFSDVLVEKLDFHSKRLTKIVNNELLKF